MRIIYLYLADIRILCGGLTYGQNGVNMCHMKSCSSLKHPNMVTGSIIPHHAYPMITESHILHLLPTFFYKYFTEETLLKLQQ